MRNKKTKSTKSRKRERSRRQLQLESLESRIMLTGTPTQIDLNLLEASEPSDIMPVGAMTYFVADDGTDGIELSTLLPEGEQTTKIARVTIYVDSQQVTIPANIGVNSDGSMAAVFTNSTNGEVISENGSMVTLGDFFDTWRTDAGLAGNNANAILSDTQLFNNTQDSSNTVQMFVNGQVSNDFGDYVLQNGDEIVLVYGDNPVVSLNTNFGAIVIELFENETPGTVDNFLNYVNDGDYINSFFHRSSTNFVIQGGGFTTSSTTFTNTNQFSTVPTDPPILNEPGISNLRTTIAMAKTSNPDSATSQFFVNLNDDNTFLDNPSNSGGFTVFGQVLDMTTSDTIAALPINFNNASPFGELPLSSSNQLAVIQAIEGQGKITGVKFSDDNANGVQDVGEAAIAGVSIYIDANNNGLLDPGEAATTTDANGRYLLQVEPGTYIVRSEISAGQASTVPVSPESYTVTVEIGREVSGIDFGEADLPAPTGVDLLASSDSGSSNTDDITRHNNATGASLQFEISGVTPGAEVKLFSDGVQVGSAIATISTVTVDVDSVNVISDGSHAITATQAFAGGESFASAALTVTIDTMAPAEIASIAGDLAQVEQAYTFDADSPDEGQSGIVYSLANAPSGMTIDTASGIVSWTPTAAQVGPQSFAIEVSDAAGNTSSQTVNLTVLGVIPALPDDYTIAEDSTLTVDVSIGVLENDGDMNSGTLTASVVDQPTNGSISFSSDGSFTYSPAANFFGSDSFTYVASDGVNSSTAATVTITVSPQPDDPTANDDTATSISNGIAATIDVIMNDSSEPDELQSLVIIAVTQGTSGGTVTFTGTEVSYVSLVDSSGIDTFTYTIQDSDGLTDTATVTVTVSEPANNSLSGFVYIDFDNDGVRDDSESGVPGAQITLSGVDLSGSPVNRTMITTNLGFYSFDELPAGTYQISQQQPAALTDGLDSTLVPGATVGNDIISNIVLSSGQSFAENNFGETSILPQYVSIAWFFAFSPSLDVLFREAIAIGEETAGNTNFAAEIRDSEPDAPEDDNSPPVALNDSYSIDEDTTLTIDAVFGLLGNDTDPENNTLSALLRDLPGHGTLSLDVDGSFIYDPEADFHGTDSFTYVANDGSVDSEVATVLITINSVNDEPQAAADEYSANEDSTFIASTATGVLANDTDADGDDLTAALVDDVEHGSLTLNADGSFVYTPNADFSGADSFTYTATDGTATTDATLVSITVVDQNTFSIAENSPAGTVVGEISPEGDLGATVVYSIDEPNLDTELELAADDHISGNPAGSVVLIEYVDFQCPACQTIDPVVEQLLQDFPDDLMVVTRHFPLESIHSNAFAAAVASEAAGRQGAFEEYGNLLFDNQDDWNDAADPQSFFEIYATDLGLDLTQFQADQSDQALTDRVQRDLDAAIALGGLSTPTFFLNGQMIVNPVTLKDFAALIQAAADEADDVFGIDRLTGQITVHDSAALDFELTPSFSFTVNAVGLGASETIMVTINLTNDPADD